MVNKKKGIVKETIRINTNDKVFDSVPGCKLVLTKYYSKNESIDYAVPDIIDLLSNSLMVCDKNSYGMYAKTCSEKFKELISIINADKSSNSFFVYKEPKALPRGVMIEPEDIDIYRLVESGNVAKRYRMKYNENKTGVVLVYDHDVPYYTLQSITTGESIDIKEFTMDIIVNNNEVVLKNVFNFIKFDYFFSEEQVEEVSEIIKTFKLRICAKCGTPFYIVPRQLKFAKDKGLPLPVLCPTCAKKQRDNLANRY